jgi:hypothetical protein
VRKEKNVPRKLSEIRESLDRSLRKKWVVQFARPFESGTLSGYVLGVGSEFFLLGLLNDGFEFQQYVCVRLKDVRRLEAPANRTRFYQKVRKLRGDKIPKRLALDLTNSASMVRSAMPSVLTIYQEKVRPGTCVIGYAVSTDDKNLEFLTIDPDAEWDSKPGYYRFKDITRIDLPGPYEQALLLAGGYPKYFDTMSQE